MPTQFTQGIRFEVAQDVLGAVIAHWSEMAAQARDAANPDADHLATTSNGQINSAATADYHYLHTDHLGTVQMATDSRGNISWKGQAHAFGKTELDQANRITMNLRLPGQYYDQETGTHYNWMRDYNGSTGRYLQRDPIGLDAGSNPYLYVDANPLLDTDSEGLQRRANGQPGGPGASLRWPSLRRPDGTRLIYRHGRDGPRLDIYAKMEVGKICILLRRAHV